MTSDTEYVRAWKVSRKKPPHGRVSMRIAQVYSRFDIGGISLLMLNSAKILSKLGHECRIITRGIFFLLKLPVKDASFNRLL